MRDELFLIDLSIMKYGVFRELANDEETSSVFAVYRPYFFLVAGWIMSTAQVLRKHTMNMARYDAFVMIPAYHVFYQFFLASTMYMLFHRHNSSYIYDENADATKCNEYYISTMNRFGFLKDETYVYNFTLKLAILFVFQTLAAVLFIHLFRSKPKDLRTYRKHVIYYSFAYLLTYTSAYWIMTKFYRDSDVIEDEDICKKLVEDYM